MLTSVQKIDNILKKKGISRRKLAISAGIPPSTLQSAIERNEEISLSIMIKICIALDVDIYDIMGDEELKYFLGDERC